MAESRGIEVLVFDGPGGRADLLERGGWLGRKRYLSLMIEAGSKINWTALETGVVDRVFFYYGPKILGGLEALPLAGGIGRRRRADAIRSTRSPSIPSRRTNSPWKATWMFSGIVEELGTVESLDGAGRARALRCAAGRCSKTWCWAEASWG